MSTSVSPELYFAPANVSDSPRSEDDACYRRLANAIVIQAIRDYHKALKQQETFVNEAKIKQVKKEIKDLEDFFCSDWCRMLCGHSGPWLVQRIRSLGPNFQKKLEDIYGTH